MSCVGESEKQWKCATVRVVNIQRVGSIVRDIGEPCVYQSPLKGTKMLKPDKWKASFDGDGKVCGFSKALKLIIMGGVDASIRAEVWEFLLGCYKLNSTAEIRRQLRAARREKFLRLVTECQKMHPTIGTGDLAYAVGSKLMDVRIPSIAEKVVEQEVRSSLQYNVDATLREDDFAIWKKNCTDIPSEDELEGYSDSTEPSVRKSTEFEPSWFPPRRRTHSETSLKMTTEGFCSNYTEENSIEFPALPVTNLFGNREDDNEHTFVCNEIDPVHHISSYNSVQLTIEARDPPEKDISVSSHGKLELSAFTDVSEQNNLNICETPASSGTKTVEGRVSEWLWTLHRIVVDVVRTDSHLEFYDDKKNLARMSDILAVYAWVDPSTGYCQGMSDLLSPFVVLFEDNADAFWCFEMLLRRMRGNFQMEGPTGVMKQLETLWRILEVTDKEMFFHLTRIGAESLHFAFRMLMVLFRRELSFSDALSMWEMMWAADFNEWDAFDSDKHCLEGLTLDLPANLACEVQDVIENGLPVKDVSPNGLKPMPLCGLTGSFWSKNDRNCITCAKIGDDELPVFSVAAILIINRQKILRESESIDDMIKMFNDRLLKIHVRRSIRSAIKLRKKYLYKVFKRKNADDAAPPS